MSKSIKKSYLYNPIYQSLILIYFVVLLCFRDDMILEGIEIIKNIKVFNKKK